MPASNMKVPIPSQTISRLRTVRRWAAVIGSATAAGSDSSASAATGSVSSSTGVRGARTYSGPTFSSTACSGCSFSPTSTLFRNRSVASTVSP